MNLNFLKNFYYQSPYFLKKAYSLIPYRLRSGKNYRKWEDNLETGEIYNDPLETVFYALDKFNFYRVKYKGINVSNWEEIPLLTKKEIQESLSEFENYEVSKFYVTTGGVTGKPAKFLQSNNVWGKELAFVNNFFSEFGYSPGDLKASFRGGDFSKLKSNRFWQSNPINNEIHFSPFHLNELTVEEYVIKLNKTRPLFFHGYPSAFINLARLMKIKNLKLDFSPKCIFLISENYSLKDIKFLREFFNTIISSFYGHSERLIFAKSNRELNSYTPDLRYGYFELVDEKGKVIRQNNKKGEIVGTSFQNYAMPLIRYRTGDYTHYIDYESKTFAQIQGKWGQDHLLGKNGEKITLTALNLHSPELNSFIQTQFEQVEYGIVRLNVLTAENIKNSELKAIEKLLTRRVGGLITFEIKIKDQLRYNKRGKVPLIIKVV